MKNNHEPETLKSSSKGDNMNNTTEETDKTARVLNYIEDHWKDTIRNQTQDEGTLLGLPFPYSVPCIKDAMQEMYYWDTYFACRGMALQGLQGQVLGNCKNFLYELKKFGFIPNGNRRFYLNRSQPPFFGAFALFTHNLFPKDRKLLEELVSGLETEFMFWESKRRFSNGLFHYGSNPEKEQLDRFYAYVAQYRFIYPAEEPSRKKREKAAMELYAEAESGMDFTPRFQRCCPDCAAVDLNALLELSLQVLAGFYGELGELEKQRKTLKKAIELRSLINQYCWDDARGMFFDYNVRDEKIVSCRSASALVPLWTRMATMDQARSSLEQTEKFLEQPYGITACEQNDSGKIYQWNFPNGWAPHQFLAIEGFAAYNFTEAARRIASKYVSVVSRVFEKTEKLWEKYNVVNGSIEIAQEGDVEMAEMMGWTSGTYVYAYHFLHETE